MIHFGSGSQISNFDFILLSFVFGIFSYVLAILIYSLIGLDHPAVRFFESPTEEAVAVISPVDIAISAILAIIASIFWLYIETYKIISRVLKKIGATKTYGDEGVWDFTFNSRQPYVEYVDVRDFNKQLVYSGWVNAFSESGPIRELLLRDVKLYDFNGEFLYDQPFVYLSRTSDDIHIDFPYRPEDGEASVEES